MNIATFVKETVYRFNDEIFIQYKNLILRYIPFKFVSHDCITKDILCKKLCDHFEVFESKPDSLETS